MKSKTVISSSGRPITCDVTLDDRCTYHVRCHYLQWQSRMRVDARMESCCRIDLLQRLAEEFEREVIDRELSRRSRSKIEVRPHSSFH